MSLVRKSLSPALLNGTEKGTNEMLEDNFYTVTKFTFLKERTKIDNDSGEVITINEDMICFAVKEYPNTYFWASTGLYDFLMDQLEAYENDPESIPEVEYDDTEKAYVFTVDVPVKHGGKVKLKSDASKSCNTWIINV